MKRERSAWAVTCAAALAMPLALSSCAEFQACPAIAHMPFIQASVYGDTSQLHAVTACPLDTLDCVDGLPAEPAVKNAVGRYNVTLGYRKDGSGPPDVDKMQLRALDKHGKVLAQATVTLSWKLERPNDACGSSSFALANLTIGSIQ